MALPPTRASGPFRPTRLGQWEVIAKIAGGGMSAVYLGRRAADDLEPDSPKVVALKIVRHDVRMDDRLLKMFLEEGKLIARLVHPNIVRTLEVGGDGEQEFIAMELMLGKTFAPIHDTLATRDVRLNPEIAAWTAARVADALHYAHELADENGQPLALVHRDVNPANVFATFNGEVKLFDFGLAKVTAGGESGSNLLAGKLSYLSPEQIMQMPLDRRSDIFSLGITLWELLTGKRLFRRESDIDTVRAVQLGPIPDPRQVAPEIPEELARITRTALERNREHRYPTGAYLARELDAFVFTRTSPNDVTARLAQLVDTLFPGEQKRQSGWLKPAINSSMSRPGGPTSIRGVSPSSGPRERSMTPREITAVMPNAPPKPADPTANTNATASANASAATSLALTSTTATITAPPDSINALDALEALEMLETKMPAAPGAPGNIGLDPTAKMSSPLDDHGSPESAIPSTQPGEVGPMTPRDGEPSVAPARVDPSRPSSPGPLTPREGIAIAAQSPGGGSFPPTPREGIASVRPGSLPPSGGPVSGRPSWPLSTNRIAPSVPPPPQRSRPPPRNEESFGPLPMPKPVGPSRTDLHAVSIPAERNEPSSPPLRNPTPSAIPPLLTPKPPLVSGGPLSSGPLSGRGGLPRKPIPLPSSSRKMVQEASTPGLPKTTGAAGAASKTGGSGRPSVIPAAPTARDSSARITEPPDSDTQVDVPVPPDRKRS